MCSEDHKVKSEFGRSLFRHVSLLPPSGHTVTNNEKLNIQQIVRQKPVCRRTSLNNYRIDIYFDNVV